MKIKYELLEEVFFMWNNVITKKKITGIIVNDVNNYEYRFNYIDLTNTTSYFWLSSDKIFETKEELKNSL